MTSLVCAWHMDSMAKTKEMTVRIIGNTALSDSVKSPMFACVRKISKKEVTMAAFEDFMVIPANRAIKLMLTVTADFKISWI